LGVTIIIQNKETIKEQAVGSVGSENPKQ